MRLNVTWFVIIRLWGLIHTNFKYASIVIVSAVVVFLKTMNDEKLEVGFSVDFIFNLLIL